MTILIMNVLMRKIFITLNTGDINYNANNYFLIKVNKKHICDVTFINVISKVVKIKVYISIVIISE